MVERSSAMSRLYRSTRDKVMTGLAGGLSETLGIDSAIPDPVTGQHSIYRRCRDPSVLHCSAGHSEGAYAL